MHETNHQPIEISTDDLRRVTGGFLPLLGLLGSAAGLAGNIMGGIGKKKQQEAENQVAQAGGGQNQTPGQQAGGAMNAPTAQAGPQQSSG
jgi:hypothetical protein